MIALSKNGGQVTKSPNKGLLRRELAAWAKRVNAQPWREAFLFFKHEETASGPALAEKMRRLLSKP